MSPLYSAEHLANYNATDERNEAFDEAVEKASTTLFKDELATIEVKVLTIKKAHHAGLHARVDRLLSELLTHIHSV